MVHLRPDGLALPNHETSWEAFPSSARELEGPDCF